MNAASTTTLKYRPGSKQHLRMQAAERAAVIARLKMAPEDTTSPDTRYAASTGELYSWIREAEGDAAAESFRKSLCQEIYGP